MTLGTVRTESDNALNLPLVVVTGEVDLALAPVMDEHISAVLDRSEGGVIVDLAGATFIDSVALGVLISTLHRSEDSGAALYLVIADPRVKRVFELTGLDTSFTTFESRSELMQHLSERDSLT